MNKRRFLAFVSATMASFLLAIVFQLRVPSPIVTAQPNATLLVSTAASLKDAMEEIRENYQQRTPGISINYNFGASGALMQQIQQGATSDIFISAAKKQVDTLEQSGIIVVDTRSILAKNRLVLIVPKLTVGVTSFYNLTTDNIKKIAVGEPRSVPAGEYAEQVLQKLGIYHKLKPKFVYGNNVRQVLAAVEAGNADAGLVYQTDAAISNKIKIVVAADEKYHSPIVYPMAVLKQSKNITAARQFIKYLSSEEAKAIFDKYGFITTGI
ncbi:molybdate ABC transporter substrate-binding protein [Calothrix sp. PCC 6303]|uniref:molybdate ABC transporter substrate-binding protein n=1 Tax=Calothrix sp. PCC 6303 TaxID=1170562 RepID=UPI0002A0566D|nr:molybdate ABC transporter substrate-binding protein [Calothrix sp. PCC 6303]AFY99734.1 molybdenum ABC transporter, periplasmic molybdate-binding protein [Calothrix sp. PCC 6303]